ncbi:DUF4317 family protein [Lentibacillus halodurans]|uniref:DUF4317 family protein n=1 Tax=Lentibacillus halodurans TaxID=237679 RepID=UPI000B7FF5E2|nr:DUF4317 family protein [Lentibacillus halodurans]
MLKYWGPYKIAEISIRPQDVKHVRQVHFNGKRYLMIEVEENMVSEGFEMMPAALFQKAPEDE